MKTAVVVVLTVLLVAAQTTLCPLIRVMGVHPNTLMAAVACVGLLYGRIVGGAAGLLCGLWIDALFPATFGVYILFSSMCGLLSGGWKNAEAEHRWWGAHLDAILSTRTFAGRWRSNRVLRPFLAAGLMAAGLEFAFAMVVYFMRLPINVVLVPLQVVASGGVSGLIAVVCYQLYALAGPRERRGVFAE